MVAFDFTDETNPWSEEHWSLTEQGRYLQRAIAKYGERFGTDKARAFAAQAGTALGAPRPRKQAPFQVIVQRRTIVAPATSQPTTVVLGFSESGAVGGSQEWSLAVAPRNAIFPSSTPSQAVCAVAPTDTVSLYLLSPADVLLCTVTFEAGSMIGTFDWEPNVSVNAGDVPSVLAQASPVDLTFAGVNIAFVGDVAP